MRSVGVIYGRLEILGVADDVRKDRWDAVHF